MEKNAIAASKLLKVLATYGAPAAVAGAGAGIVGHRVGVRSGAHRTANAMAGAFADANARENQAIANAFRLANVKENRLLANAYLKKGYRLGLQQSSMAGIKAAEDIEPNAFVEELEKLGFSVKGMKIDASTLKRLASGLSASYKALGKGVGEAASLGAAKVTRRIPAGMKHLRVKGMKEALRAGIPAVAVTAGGVGGAVGARRALKKNASDAEVAQFLLDEMEKDAAFPAALLAMAPAAKALAAKAIPALARLGGSFKALGAGLGMKAGAGRYLKAAVRGPASMRGIYARQAGATAGRTLMSQAARPAALTLGGAGLFGAGRMSKKRGPRFVAY